LKLEKLKHKAQRSNNAPLWQPNPDHADGTPNTQRLAYESVADVVGLSGTAGWGKTDLLLGLAANKHRRSVIFRRVFPNLRSVIERSREIFNAEGSKHSDDSFNESLHRWSIEGGSKMLEFEACQHEHDKYKQRGRPRDFYAIDEAPEFTKTIVDFITAWNRSPNPNQHCQIFLAFNVPSDDAGTWVIDYFMPWIAHLFPAKFDHPKPAKPGELRWYATVNSKEVEFESGEPVKVGREKIYPRSRTFFFGTLLDNPYYDERYISLLQAQPEPLRSQLLYGNFAVETKGDPWQVIPTAWVKAAQRRWMEREKPDMPVSGVGVDVARGGRDNLVSAKRYGTWFDEPAKTPGVNVEDGPAAAELIRLDLQNDEHIGYINIDVIGVGTSAYDSAKVIWPGLVNPVNAGAGSSFVVKTKEGQEILRMKNIRAEYHWRMRIALDPEHGDDIALPPGNEIVADLCSARYKPLAGGVIQIEEKDAIKERIGRSPDVGEAIMLANLAPPEPATLQQHAVNPFYS